MIKNQTQSPQNLNNLESLLHQNTKTDKYVDSHNSLRIETKQIKRRNKIIGIVTTYSAQKYLTGFYLESLPRLRPVLGVANLILS